MSKIKYQAKGETEPKTSTKYSEIVSNAVNNITLYSNQYNNTNKTKDNTHTTKASGVLNNKNALFSERNVARATSSSNYRVNIRNEMKSGISRTIDKEND